MIETTNYLTRYTMLRLYCGRIRDLGVSDPRSKGNRG